MLAKWARGFGKWWGGKRAIPVRRTSFRAETLEQRVLLSGTAQQFFEVNQFDGTVGEYTTAGGLLNAKLISGLRDPTGIALSGSDLFIANWVTGTIGEYTTSGVTVNASLISGLQGPEGLAVSGSDLFVTNGNDGKIGEYTTSGATVNAALISGLNGPEGLTISGSDIFVTNWSSGSIGEYTTSGATVNRSLITNLSGPIAVSINGSDLFVSNFSSGSIDEYTTSGAVVTQGLITGLSGPAGIAATDTDLLFTEFGFGTISDYTTAGVVVNATVVADLNGPLGFVLSDTAADDAALTSQVFTPVGSSTPASLLQVGQTYNASITYQNTGSTTWTPSGNNSYDLYSVQGIGPNQGYPVSGPIAPGAFNTFNFTFTPTSPGVLQWGLVNQFVDYFGPIASIAVGDSAALTSQVFTPTGSATPVTSLQAGQTYNASITFQNTGLTTWSGTGSDQYDLYSLQGDGPNQGYPVTSTIGPGGSDTFTFSFTALSTGTVMQWGLVHQNVDFFGPIASIPLVLPTDSATLTSQVFTPNGSSTPVISLTTGQTYTAMLTFLNTGNTTWINTGSDPFDLYNLQGVGPNQGYPVSTSIAPGASDTFSFSFTAVSSPGTMQWGLVHQNMDFFGPLASIAVNGPADAATLTSQVFTPSGSSTPVTSLTVGQTYTAALTYQNTGSATWIGTGNNEYDLFSLQGVGPNRGYAVSSPVAAGGSTTFTFSFTALSSPGTMQWGLVHQNNDFFGSLASIAVVPADAASLVSQVFTPVGSMTPVTSLTAGQSYNAVLTFQNTGTATWIGSGIDSYDLYNLQGVGPNQGYPVSTNTAPGGSFTFTFAFTALSSPGTMQWGLVHQNIDFFGPLASISVT